MTERKPADTKMHSLAPKIQHQIQHRQRIGMLLANQERIVAGAAAILFLALLAALPQFRSAENLLGLVRNVSVLGILSLGMAVVVIGRGIDLSVIAVMAVSMTVSVVLANAGWSFAFAMLIGFAFASAVGMVTGFLVAFVEIPSIFATLAVSAIVYGVGRGAIAQLDVNNLPSNVDWFSLLGRGSFLDVPTPIWIFAAVSLASWLFLRATGLGRFIYAVGDNQATARITGIPVRPIVVLQYMVASWLAFLAGAVTAASVGAVNMRIVNSTMIYDVLLVVVLGGIGLTGGRGGVRNVLIGTAFIGLLLNGMTILDFSYIAQNLIKSLVLLSSLIIDAIVNPRDEQIAQQGDI